jgi:hypothetical protein
VSCIWHSSFRSPGNFRSETEFLPEDDIFHHLIYMRCSTTHYTACYYFVASYSFLSLIDLVY